MLFEYKSKLNYEYILTRQKQSNQNFPIVLLVKSDIVKSALIQNTYIRNVIIILRSYRSNQKYHSYLRFNQLLNSNFY